MQRHPTGGSAGAVSEQTQEGPACTEGPLLLSLPRKTTHPAVTDNLKDGRIRNDAALIWALSHTHINETFWFKLEVNRLYSNLRQIMSLLQSNCSLESRPNCFKMVRLQYSRRKLCETPLLPSHPMNEWVSEYTRAVGFLFGFGLLVLEFGWGMRILEVVYNEMHSNSELLNLGDSLNNALFNLGERS